MINRWTVATATLVTAAILAVALFANGRQKIVDEDVYNRMVTISGHVEFLNSEVVASGAYLVFRRAECKDCLIGTNTDAKGDYSIRVGQGTYELIVYNPSSPTYDMIASTQPRFIKASPSLDGTRFDIKLRVPKAR